MLFAMVFVSIFSFGSEPAAVKRIGVEKAVPNQELLDILGAASFAIAVICAGIAIFSKDDEQRVTAGITGTMFLIVGIVLLKAC